MGAKVRKAKGRMALEEMNRYRMKKVVKVWYNAVDLVKEKSNGQMSQLLDRCAKRMKKECFYQWIELLTRKLEYERQQARL